MGMFQATGVVTVNGRPAANVTVSFAVAGKLSPGARRQVPAPLRTDKLGVSFRPVLGSRVSTLLWRRRRASCSPRLGWRWTQPMRCCDSRDGRDLHRQGVVRVAEVIRAAGKPPGIAGGQISFMRAPGASTFPCRRPSSPTPMATWRQHGFQTGASYTATASKAGLGFAPPSAEVRADVSSEFIGGSSTFSASGRIVTLGGAPDPAVAIHVERISGSGTVPAVTATDGAGAYALTGLDRASQYRITPLKPGATFEPPSRDVVFTANSFPGVLASFTRTTNLVVTGQVLTTGGAGLVGAVMTFTRTLGTGAVPLPVTTTSNGEYHAAGLDAGTTYLVSVTRDQFSSVPTTLRAPLPAPRPQPHRVPAYEVSGKVLDLELADADLQSLADLPGIPGRDRLVPSP